MTTREHLIYRLQERYAFLADFLPMLDQIRHGTTDERLRKLEAHEHEELMGEIDTLERALNLLGAQYKLEHNPIDPALQESSRRFKHQMNPSAEQTDVHHILLLNAIAQYVAAGYQGDAELARGIGEQDVALLLEENLQRQHEGYRAMRSLMPAMVREMCRIEAQRAA